MAESHQADLSMVNGILIGNEKVAAALAKFRASAPSIEAPEKLKGELLALAGALFAGDANLTPARLFIEYLFDPKLDQIAPPPASSRDRLLIENMLKLRPVVLSAGRIRPASRPITVTGIEQDVLAEDVNDWSVIRVLNLALLASIPPRKKVAIVTSVRNEGMSILEWLAHHRASGFEDFFVYTNDNTDGSDALLENLANFEIIRLFKNEVGAEVKIQKKILEHSTQMLPELRDFEWVFYIDVDEFFISRCEPGLTLDSFFKAFQKEFPIDPPSAISINWKWFGSENVFEMSEGLLLERFQHSIHNEHVKSLVRLRDVLSMHRVHAPVLVNGATMVNGNFEKIQPALTMEPKYGKAQLNHYWNKSFQEFVLKRRRGRISQGLSGQPLQFSSFFDWGANGRRGNFDPPQEQLVARAKHELNLLCTIPDVSSQLSEILRQNQLAFEALSAEFDLSAIYKARGQID